jgi:cystathionine beta-synthase
MQGRIDYVFAGMGTGGTITGIARFLKQRSNAKVIGVEPVGSIFRLVKSGIPVEEAMKRAHSYLVEGIGEEMLPGTVDLDLVDDIIVVEDQKAFSMARLLARIEGILAGGSSGAALYGALSYLKENGVRNARVLVILPDTGRNYLSKIYNDEWMLENGFEVDDEKVLEVLRS